MCLSLTLPHESPLTLSIEVPLDYLATPARRAWNGRHVGNEVGVVEREVIPTVAQTTPGPTREAPPLTCRQTILYK